jgi:hypothetical protein
MLSRSSCSGRHQQHDLLACSREGLGALLVVLSPCCRHHSRLCVCLVPPQGSRNVVYLCQNHVSEACLAEKAPDACVNELIDSLLASNTHQQHGPPLAAILVPVMLVGA